MAKLKQLNEILYTIKSKYLYLIIKVYYIVYGVSRLGYSFCYQGRVENHIKKKFEMAHSPCE